MFFKKLLKAIVIKNNILAVLSDFSILGEHFPKIWLKKIWHARINMFRLQDAADNYRLVRATSNSRQPHLMDYVGNRRTCDRNHAIARMSDETVE